MGETQTKSGVARASHDVYFRSVTHQDRCVAFLQGAVANGREAHAYLFTGPAGAGGLVLARALARTLLCSARTGTDACGACRSCRLFANAAHPDHSESGLDKAKRQEFSIDQVREIIDLSHQKPVAGRRRTFIMRDADRLSLAGANSLLKILEEPPGPAVFILLAGNTQRIPATIVSRCQLLRLKPVAAEDIGRMMLDSGCESAEADWLAEFAGGSPMRALKAKELALYDFLRDAFGECAPIGIQDNFSLAKAILEKASESAGVNGEGGGALTAVQRRQKLIFLMEGVLAYFRHQVPSAAKSPGISEEILRYVRICDIIIETVYALDSNANPALTLQSMWTRIALMEKSA